MTPLRIATIMVPILLASPVMAQQDAPATAPDRPVIQMDQLSELDRKADELSEAARRTIEEFVNLVGPMLTRLSRLIEDLPVYETPEILPNGDIIIRRKRAPLPSPDKGDDGLTET